MSRKTKKKKATKTKKNPMQTWLLHDIQRVLDEPGASTADMLADIDEWVRLVAGFDPNNPPAPDDLSDADRLLAREVILSLYNCDLEAPWDVDKLVEIQEIVQRAKQLDSSRPGRRSNPSAAERERLKRRLCGDDPVRNTSHTGARPGARPSTPSTPGVRASLSITPTAMLRTYSSSLLAPKVDVYLMVGEDLRVFDAIETRPNDFGLVVEAGYDVLPAMEIDVSRDQLLKFQSLARSFESQFALQPRRFDPGMGQRL